MNHHNTTALLPAVDQLQWSEPQSQSLQCMFLVGQCGFKFCSLCSLLAFIIPLQPFVASLCHTYIHPSSRLKWSCKHTHFSSCLQHLATTGPSLPVIHPVLWLNSRLLSKEIPQTQSSTRTASKRSFHFNKTLKAKQLFQKRGMAKRGCQTFFSAFDLGVWGAHLCQTCSTQLPSTSQWEETVLNQYSSMLCYALATTHELLMTSLPAVAQAWLGPSSTHCIKSTSWLCPTQRRFFH